MMQNNLSEVALLRQQIDLAYEAAQRGMSGYAITASHEFITHRLEELGLQLETCKAALIPLVGEEQATTIVAESSIRILGS